MASAITDFQYALWIQPNHFLALADLGVTLAALGRYQEAAQRLLAAVAQDDRPAELHFILGQCRLNCDDLRGAAESFAAAITRRPQFADAYNNLGVVLDRLGDSAKAVRCFEQARSLEPKLATAHRNLADLLRRMGRAREASGALLQAVELQPENADLRCELSELLCDAGLWEEAFAAAHEAASRAPGSARAHAAVGMALLGAERWTLAAESLARAVKLDVTLAYAAVNLGEALWRLQRPREASEAYRKALEARNKPVEAYLGLGRALIVLRDAPGAAQCFHQAHALRPTDPTIALEVASRLEELGHLEAAATVLHDITARVSANSRLHHALGQFLHRRGRLEEAVTSYNRALSITPDDSRTVLDCAHALESLGQLTSAVAGFEHAKALQPQQASEALAGLVSCAFRGCDWSGGESALTALQALPEGLDALHPFLLLAAGVSPPVQLRVLTRRARRLNTRPMPEWTFAQAAPHPQHSHPRLRVAYLSPDFREHPVAHAIVSVIEHHDRSHVQPIGISFAAPDRSAIGARLRAAFESVLDASKMSDSEVVARLRELEVDIAVDLAGFTAGARTEILAARCAPIQVSYLGFPATTGASFMDYVIADDVVLPKSAESDYAEQVLRLPHCYLPFDGSRVVTAPCPDRTVVGLPERGFVFCAFNNSYKITRSMFQTWMGLLQEVSGSVLWLRSMGPDATSRLRHAADRSGVASSRLIFAPHIERIDEHLARLQCADLFLDTLPYNAHTTAADALWAGLPVLTCQGNSFAGRVSASLLTSAGLPDLICLSLDDYRSKALHLAAHPDALHGVRSRLASSRTAPPFDSGAYTRNLESLYTRMARRQSVG